VYDFGSDVKRLKCKSLKILMREMDNTEIKKAAAQLYNGFEN